jgi:hypothetical protein
MPGWTPEARKRQAKLIRQWRPWEKSTGPQTPAGKARSGQNGLPLLTQDEWAELDAAIASISTFLLDTQKP